MKTTIKLNSILGIGSLVIIAFVMLSAFGIQQDKKWEAPESAKKMKNPVASNEASVAEGKVLYAQFCKSCHGAKGKGDGPKAANLEKDGAIKKCGDFSTKEFQSKTDGEIFWMTTEGNDPMPTFKKKIADESDRWKIVNYMRTLAAK